ncbi:MAG: 2'-5' RNA ligase family protein [Pseudomonadota bacterium]
MPLLYALAYPVLKDRDRTFIDAYRDRHDVPYRDVVAPHFTLVFGCEAVSEKDFCDHVEQVAGQMSPVYFVCRYAMLGVDHQSPTGHVFLVPDEGYGALSLLHDRLYTGVLRPHLRLDIPFTPHITIGTVDDLSAARRLCDALNRDGVEIIGRVEALTVGALVEGRIRDLARLPLGR